jgi:hypothetical protein
VVGFIQGAGLACDISIMNRLKATWASIRNHNSTSSIFISDVHQATTLFVVSGVSILQIRS